MAKSKAKNKAKYEIIILNGENKRYEKHYMNTKEMSQIRSKLFSMDIFRFVLVQVWNLKR